MAKETLRLLRVIEYVGNAEFIRQSITRRSVRGRMEIGKSGNYIQEAIVGETGELLSVSPEIPEAEWGIGGIAIEDPPNADTVDLMPALKASLAAAAPRKDES